MNEPETACPTAEKLNLLVQSSLPSDEQAFLQAHVDSCPACQDRLASIVAGSESWDAALDNLRGDIPPSEDTILSDVVKRMKSENSEAIEKSNSGHLDLLTPSDHPGSIGRLGTYEVTEVIGQGGMGVVLKAFDPSLHRVVAVKMLAPYLAHNPHARKRFVREAQAIAAVSHDHVITIHAIDESEEQPKIVMQYVAGQSLQQKIDAQGSLELKEILRIGMQTASGLAAAHAQGLVHRDIKPSNILLENGVQRVRLTDFGLARAVDDASLTQSGVIAGTPQYMAPEQANGDAVDFRADLFSLGSVLYAMCVGHSPFRASTTMGVLKRVCHDSPRPIHEINTDIPDWLCNIVMKLLAKKPEDRFASAKSVAELLEKWLAHVQQPTIVARPRDITIEPGTLSADSTNPNQQKESHAAEASAEDDVNYAQTLFFQPVNRRMIIFLTLAGTAITMAWAASQQPMVSPGAMLSFSLFSGMIICMLSVMLISLYRFIYRNMPGRLATIDASTRDAKLSKIFQASENLALLTAIFLISLTGNVVVALVVAIMVWFFSSTSRTGGRSAGSQNSAEGSPVNSQAATDSNEAIRELLPIFIENSKRVIHESAMFVQRVAGQLSVDNSSTWLSVCWFLCAAIDIVAVLSMNNVPGGFILVTNLMCIISLAVSHCISVRQNPQFVRAMSFVGLLPIFPGAFARIPASIITLYMLSRADFRESFDKQPWPETTLGQLVHRSFSFARHTTTTILLLGLWSGLFLLLVVVGILYVVVPYIPAEYRVYDEARATVRGVDPSFNLRLTAIGSGNVYGLQQPTASYRRQSLWIRTSSAGAHKLHIIFGEKPINAETGAAVTLKDLGDCLSELPEDVFPLIASNLYEVVQTLNRLAIADSSTGLPLRSLGFRERIEVLGNALRRGTESPDEEQAAHFDENVINASEIFVHQQQYVKPADFQTIGSLLNNKLLNVTTSPAWTRADCNIPTLNAITDALIGILLWLAVCLLIIKRRHFSRRTSEVQNAPAAANA